MGENYAVVVVLVYAAYTVRHSFQIGGLHIFAENIQRAKLVEFNLVAEAFAVFFDKQTARFGVQVHHSAV